MSRIASLPPFSPCKGKIPQVDPAFEFEAPRFCDLKDDNYDFYNDLEKNIWFEETHWLHEPPEKRPITERAKRKSVIPNLAAPKRRMSVKSLVEESPAKLKRVTLTRGENEEEKGRRAGSFERDANFSPSRVFAPLSDNIASSPLKLRGPQRILFTETEKENAQNFENEELGDENVKILKGRKSIVPSRISDGKNKISSGGELKAARKDTGEPVTVKTPRTSAENIAPAARARTSGEIKTSTGARTSGEIRTSSGAMISVGESSISNGKEEKSKTVSIEVIATKRKSSGVEKDVKASGESEQQKKSVTIKTRKSGDGKLESETVRRKSTIRGDVEVTGRNSGGSNLKLSNKTEPLNTKVTREETETQKKIRARKSISSIAYINSNSTTYNIPNKPTLNPPHAPLAQRSKSEHSLLSTIPLLDAVKCVTTLPTRVSADELGEEENQEVKQEVQEAEEEPNETNKQKEKEKEKEVRERPVKRKSNEMVAAEVVEKPKRVRSSIMTCPVPAKKKAPAPVVEKPAPPPANKEKKVIKPKQKGLDFELDDNIAALLEQHNKKFKPVAAYVPRNFSTKDVKMWEEYSGKKWYSLTSAEREEANDWIKHTKAQL